MRGGRSQWEGGVNRRREEQWEGGVNRRREESMRGETSQ